ncbi:MULTISPECIES: trypsin-like serine peptidase [unclassified Streptomyces]|uniref:trypsin-like serine peptidase n=1 Tax=unclassified Streptomyces TaxID=2593676 RepID=UPI003820A21D
MRNVGTPALLVGCALLLLLPLTSAQATAPPPGAARPAASGAHDRTASDAYWTAARMRAAEPVEGGGDRDRTPAPSPSKPFAGLPIVGTFFWSDASGSGHSCGGTVVDSPGRDLVVSAGHCFEGKMTGTNLAFVPQYDDGKKPYGSYSVQRNGIFIDNRYLVKGQDTAADLDFVFLRLNPRDGVNIQDALGGAELMVNSGYEHDPVRLIGYPDNQQHPLDCTDRTVRFDSPDPDIPGSFLKIKCAAYSGGSSGGPFLVRRMTGWGIIGVIGGWKTGGDEDDISYSSYFDNDTKELYEKAVNAPDNSPASAAREVLSTSGTWKYPEALAMEILQRG